jgi:hypothetical protein
MTGRNLRLLRRYAPRNDTLLLTLSKVEVPVLSEVEVSKGPELVFATLSFPKVMVVFF